MTFSFKHSALPSETAVSIELACGSLLPSAEAAPDDSASAPCYGCAKDIAVLPIIESERELIQVQRQVLLADVVIGAHHAALEQAP